MKRKINSEKDSSSIYRDLSGHIEQTWQYEIRDFFYDHRILAYVTLGILTWLFSIIVGATTVLVVTTSLLYLAIVFVNLDLKEIQQSQNEIMENERRSLIEITNVDFTEDPCNYSITNYGMGFATGLTVVFKLHFPGKTDLTPETSFRYIHRVGVEGRDYRSTGSSIPKTDKPIKFQGTPLIRYSGIDHEFDQALQEFLDEGIERINFQIAIVYTNSLGEVGQRTLTPPLSAYLKEDMTFQDMMEESVRLGGYERDVMFNTFDISDIIHTRDPEKLREPGIL